MEERFRGRGKLCDAEGERYICDAEFIVGVQKTPDGMKGIDGILHNIKHETLITLPGNSFVLKFSDGGSCDITVSQILADGTGSPSSCRFTVNRIHEAPRSEEAQLNAI